MRNTRADVVDAALRVLDAHGLENCSMRRVAQELGVQPSALYHHVPDKQTLLAHMADVIVAGAEVGAGGGTGAPERDPAAFCRALRSAMLAVRDGADVVATASAFRLGASDAEAGLAELAGADGARTLLLYTFGHAQSTQTRLQAAQFGALCDPESAAEAPGASNPAAIAADLDASFDRGVAIILAGLAA